MSLIKWQPVFDVFEDIDGFFASGGPRRAISRTFAPAINIRETDDSVVVETPLPGIDPSKVDITIENDVLTIEGRDEKRSEVEEQDYSRLEWTMQSFHRSVALPVAVQSDDAQASYQNGVLTVTIPKREEAKAKKVSVKVKE